MRDQDRLLQRYVDGELPADQGAALRHMLATDAVLHQALAKLEGLHGQLARAHQRQDQDHDLLVSIREKLPLAAPARSRQLRVADIVFLVSLTTTIGLIYGLVGSFHDLIPLTVVAILSMVCGAILITMARPLQDMKTGLISRFAQSRFNLGCSDVAIYRVVGITIFIGGIWLIR